MNPQSDIDKYIETFSGPVQKMLRELLQAIREAAPGAQETISYDMPTFALNGKLVYFAGFKKHIGLYGAVEVTAALGAETERYKYAKGTLRFPLDEPLPLELIKKIVRLKVEANARKGKG